MAMWPEDEQHDSRMDAAIDAAARQMTDGAHGVDLKARVLARIDDSESSRSRWRLAWMLAPIAGAAILLVIIVARPFHPSTCSGCPERVEGQGRDRGPERPALQPPVAQGTEQRLGPTPTQPAAQVQTTHPPTLLRPKPDTTNEIKNRPRIAPSEIDALAPEPLDVESIRVAALPPADSIRLEPLETIAPIDVAPLGIDIDDSQRREP
jgi:hypothetical protein